MAKGKVETYLGFCKRAGKLIIGSGAIKAQKGGVYLIIISSLAAKNTQKIAMSLKTKFDCPLLLCRGDFDKAVNRPDSKIAAVRDLSLAKAILESGDENYEIYGGGDNL